jgi:excisionase family DNA binding protein
MTDSADHLAAAIRQIVKESVEVALRAQPPTSPPPPPPVVPPADRMLYSVKEVQMKLGIGRSTVYHLLNDRHLASVRVGSRRFVTAAALTDYVQGLS